MTSTITATEVPTSRVRACPSLVVGLVQSGLVVPALGDHEPVPLDLGGIMVIEGLVHGADDRDSLVASVAAASGSDPAAVTGVLAALEERGLAITDDGTQSHGPLAPVAGPLGTVDPSVRSQPLFLETPVLLRCTTGGFEHLDHEGQVRIRLRGIELVAAALFRFPTLAEQAFVSHAQLERSLDREGFFDLVDRLLAAGFVRRHDPEEQERNQNLIVKAVQQAFREQPRRLKAVNEAFDRMDAEHDARGGPADRVPVVVVNDDWRVPPGGMGLVIAYAKAYDGGRLGQSYDFRPRMFWDPERIARDLTEPSVAMFSNYVWCAARNLDNSALVKRVNPYSITVHGGPNTPKYEGDVERFFAEHPHVDVTVRGEGEATFADLLDALRGHIGDGPPDLSPLADVPGLSFRLGDRVIRTPDRDRIADLDTIPSPYLTGLFDGFIPTGSAGGVNLETNRGCPYGCTFCDWGSATLSRIRKFDLDRVFAELEWGAKHGFGLGLTDANFGIFERDVEIAQKIADLKRTYGAPSTINNNYAKNTVKHLSKIIEIFTEVGIVAEGKMSMQSMDQGTLATIRRKNIKVEKYDDLSVEFARNRLPMSAELMMGLPGSTVDTLRNDFQECIGRDVRTIAYHTVLLPNSPMNDPEYRKENGIVARPGEEVNQTASYTEADWHVMKDLTSLFVLSENFGILRQVGMYVRAETGEREIDFYERFVADARANPSEWPMVAVTYQAIPQLMVPPVSWALFCDEVRRYLVEVVGIADDSALDTLMVVQHALQPSRDRSFPLQLELPHDYVAWHREVTGLRQGGHRNDWPEHVTPLRNLGPGTLPIDDPYDVCTTSIGGTSQSLCWESLWDFSSPISRARQRTGPVDDVPAFA